ncbi:50S ribosomal protein L24 [Desulfurispira natronophila]|uniref:Large ribosomal subunit protein uL24 n=1 Tax=Desulfurispira natronophila TaxID=682562 RepID=A0A7W7Y5E3_9BACT|nr:50S ribosomal protein L24 [Desulfurispira natronophila]MBB5022416.1 large subunit ribosomal protein L24 [Desulfurispira natronophila]
MSKAKLKLKQDDQVMVTAGKDKGKTGRVIKVYPEKRKVVVEGVNVVKRHRKPTQFNEGGVEEKEMPLDVSNVMYYDAEAEKVCRIGYKTDEDGSKVRYCKQTGTVID